MPWAANRSRATIYDDREEESTLPKWLFSSFRSWKRSSSHSVATSVSSTEAPFSPYLDSARMSEMDMFLDSEPLLLSVNSPPEQDGGLVIRFSPSFDVIFWG